MLAAARSLTQCCVEFQERRPQLRSLGIVPRRVGVYLDTVTRPAQLGWISGANLVAIALRGMGPVVYRVANMALPVGLFSPLA